MHPLLASSVSVSSHGVINLLVAVIILGLVYWVCTAIPLPEPFLRIAKVILVVVAALVLIDFLLRLTGSGGGFISW